MQKEGKHYALYYVARDLIRSSNAGFFLYIDLSPWLDESSTEAGNEREYALAQRLLDGGVGLHPCEEHNDIPGHFRLVFSQDRDTLSEGLKRSVAVTCA